MTKFVYAIEGLDRLGKSTLIEGIKQELGFFQVIHFGKPERLARYKNSTFGDWQSESEADPQLFNYQAVCFRNSMKIAMSGARIIFDRWHLGEAVYAPLYRGYDGSYVFDIEKRYKLDQNDMVRLILLVEDFNISKHFISDGDSFDDNRRKEEQQMFIDAFLKSNIRDKKMICVTDPKTGLFLPPEEILKEAIS